MDAALRVCWMSARVCLLGVMKPQWWNLDDRERRGRTHHHIASAHGRAGAVQLSVEDVLDEGHFGRWGEMKE